MKFPRLMLPVLLFGSPLMIAAQSQPLTLIASPRFCLGAAQSMRDWGWSDSSDGSASSLSSIVSAVNRQLREKAGHLPAEEIARLKESARSDDPCIREVSLGILKTQVNGARGYEARGVADAGKRGALRDFSASRKVAKSVTRSLEKQSPTREDITP